LRTGALHFSGYTTADELLIVEEEEVEEWIVLEEDVQSDEQAG